jgi:flagellar protein FliS
MLYDRAIADLQRAMVGVEAHGIQQRTNHLNHFFSIIAQLEGSLDQQRGGQVAKDLAAFYQHARTQAFEAAVKNSKDILSELSEHFSTLRDAWQEAERRLMTQSASSPAEDRSAMKDGSNAGTVEVSIFD